MNPHRVLIVEDDAALCDIMYQSLSACGDLDVCGTAHNGRQALDYIEVLRPDLVLLDLVMPAMDGIEVLKRLDKQRFPDMRILVSSAVDESSIIDESMRVGADYYIVKPIEMHVLIDRIRILTNASCTASSMRIEKHIAAFLQGMEIPSHNLGYTYIMEALDLLSVIEQDHIMMKELYQSIAQKHNTSVDCVEGAIRKAVQCAHRSSSENYRMLARGQSAGKYLSNARFLKSFSDYVKYGEFVGGKSMEM